MLLIFTESNYIVDEANIEIKIMRIQISDIYLCDINTIAHM